MHRALLAVLLSGALAVLAAGCGGGDEREASSAVDWADGVCAATAEWTDALKAIGERFTDLSNLSRNSLEEATSDARQATEDFIATLRELGAPETDSGQEAKRALDSLASELETGVAEIQETVEGIEGITGIPSAIASIGGTLTTLSQEASSTLQTLTSGDLGDELETAFTQAPACDELTAASS
ncbi:MAG: hypothetical protein KatS3mg012_1805 [Gaiellaceae bacterium]|nr:MAG: hypothetical protein KatS3mg012_1805 [Gaiellaceae bacterium]